MTQEFVAHVRKSDKVEQSVFEHLSAVAALSKTFAAKLDIGLAGEVIGLVHDLGKYSQCFQKYLLSAVGNLNPDIDNDFVNFKDFKGKIDHSTAGSQWIWHEYANSGQVQRIIAQILSLSVASHHSGLIDCIGATDEKYGRDLFSARMRKPDEKTHLEEAKLAVSEELAERFHRILNDEFLVGGFESLISNIVRVAPKKQDQTNVVQVQISLLVRYLFSCLIDADRVDTADFEYPFARKIRQFGEYEEWAILCDRLETFLNTFSTDEEINKIRSNVSNSCRQRANADRGIFSLSVPTGGGKTLASLRFGLHHASKHQMDRIIYVIPYTSIIDQNADQVRKILERDGESIVLEHHSNLAPEKVGFREKTLSENWDVPVVFTTMVQFLESLFGAGTRAPRRMHQLAKSVIIFDEIQSLPVNCVHLFNNAINFLVEQCKASVVLCTATQPLLHKVDEHKGCLKLSDNNEIMSSIGDLYASLRRVQVLDQQKSDGWKDEEIADLAIEEMQSSGSCLYVANTKGSARAVYDQVCDRLETDLDARVYHLSTSMCPVHRRFVLKRIKRRLKFGQPVICISTQLIEAGVDIDFGAAIRACAGLPSIAQTAGRCNRNAKQKIGNVHIVNPKNENLKSLPEIQIGKETTNRVLSDFKDNPEQYDNDLIGEAAMRWYFENYFYRRKDEMSYNVSKTEIGHDDTILNLLGLNAKAVSEFANRENRAPDIYLRQAFMTAAKAFKVIDAPTRGVIVPYRRKGKELVARLAAAEFDHEIKSLLREAQQFTVNVFPNIFNRLKDQKALIPIASDIEIFCVDGQFYDQQFGLADEPVSPMEFLNA
jgi:CRISPR-associated endonuclease/helicase Cas3